MARYELTVLLLLVAIVPTVYSYLSYRNRIPNGHNIRDPCNLAIIWPGVGHFNQSGGGARNPFGLDFHANNKTWNATLCNQDSDKDGRTNGQELGDPLCVWTEINNGSALPTGLSHPGICEPLTAASCMLANSWLHCNPKNGTLRPSSDMFLLLLLCLLTIASTSARSLLHSYVT